MSISSFTLSQIEDVDQIQISDMIDGAVAGMDSSKTKGKGFSGKPAGGFSGSKLAMITYDTKPLRVILDSTLFKSGVRVSRPPDSSKDSFSISMEMDPNGDAKLAQIGRKVHQLAGQLVVTNNKGAFSNLASRDLLDEAFTTSGGVITSKLLANGMKAVKPPFSSSVAPNGKCYIYIPLIVRDEGYCTRFWIRAMKDGRLTDMPIPYQNFIGRPFEGCLVLSMDRLYHGTLATTVKAKCFEVVVKNVLERVSQTPKFVESILANATDEEIENSKKFLEELSHKESEASSSPEEQHKEEHFDAFPMQLPTPELESSSVVEEQSSSSAPTTAKRTFVLRKNIT